MKPNKENPVSHEDQICLFINSIEFFIVNSKQITLQLNHIQDMFQIFVTDALTTVETREFFNFLTKKNENSRSRERMHLLDEKLRF